MEARVVALGRGCRGAPRRVTGSVCQEPALPSASVVSVEKRSFPAGILPCHQPDGPSPKGRVRRVRAVLSCAASRSLSGVPDASRRGTALPLTRGSPGVAVGRSGSCLASLPPFGTGRGAGARDRRVCFFGPASRREVSGAAGLGLQRSAFPADPAAVSRGNSPWSSPRVASWRSQGWLQASRWGRGAWAARRPGSRGFGGGDPWPGPSLQLGPVLGVACVMCFSSDELQMTEFLCFHPNDGIW